MGPHTTSRGAAPLPVAPSMTEALRSVRSRPARGPGRRTLFITAIAAALGVVASGIAWGLMRLIGFITNLAFFGRVSTALVSPAGHHLGVWVLVVPVLGGLVVGVMARYGSSAIRGHGIPEAMEQVLFNKSRIPARVMFLKPLSSAVAIGTGGPFGAEGPIIATGAALGSFVGQLVHINASERKTLLAAGAAAGMSATFGSPVAAVLLAIELLLFELNPRSLIPVALASSTAAAGRVAIAGSAAVFPMPALAQPGGVALAFYIALGAVVGVAAVLVTKLVYRIEDAFEHLPIHWMWWPAIGGVAVGAVALLEPRTLGVGYDNIDSILSGTLMSRAVIALGAFKLVSWAISLGSGTSGGTLAPLFTIGGALGSALGALAVLVLPGAGVDVRVAALVGMAAIFAGASHALLASVVFAFETTRQPMGLLPLLAGCSTAYLISTIWMKTSIMTEKIVRRGAPLVTALDVDALAHALVGDYCSRDVVTLDATSTLADARLWLLDGTHQHQGFPVVDGAGKLLGVVARRAIQASKAPGDSPVSSLVERLPVVVEEGNNLRVAAELMARHDVGRLVVVAPGAADRVAGILTRSNLLAARRASLDAAEQRERSFGRLSLSRMQRS